MLWPSASAKRSNMNTVGPMSLCTHPMVKRAFYRLVGYAGKLTRRGCRLATPNRRQNETASVCNVQSMRWNTPATRPVRPPRVVSLPTLRYRSLERVSAGRPMIRQGSILRFRDWPAASDLRLRIVRFNHETDSYHLQSTRGLVDSIVERWVLHGWCRAKVLIIEPPASKV